MDVSEDKIKKIYRYLEIVLFLLLQATRFMPYYNDPGISVFDGWIATSHSRLLFLLTIILFFGGTFIRNHRIIAAVLQTAALFISLVMEYIFIEFADFYKLSWLSYGFWMNLCITIVIFILILLNNIGFFRRKYRAGHKSVK